MSEPRTDSLRVDVCADDQAVAALATRCARAERLAVDVEANGLFAYRPALCTMQLSWTEEGVTRVAIVDTLRARVAPLAAVLGPTGPVKVLHDLTFDAKLLDEAGTPLGRARDTSVAARLLGHTATGLATLLEAELGVRHDKAFQQHDWAARPLTPPQLAYLADDVRHLLTLDERLAERARTLGIDAEIDEECAYKLGTALRPPRDARPAWVRLRGAVALDAIAQAVLCRLVGAREAIAEREDVPPFKVVGNDVLLELAKTRPAGRDAVRRVRGAGAGRAGRYVETWSQAIAAGIADGAPPEDERAQLVPERRDRTLAAKVRAREAEVSAWRKREAAVRGVDEQAILPGHCAHDVVELLVKGAPEGLSLAQAIAGIAGFGPSRAARYAEALAALAADVEPPPAV